MMDSMLFLRQDVDRREFILLPSLNFSLSKERSGLIFSYKSSEPISISYLQLPTLPDAIPIFDSPVFGCLGLIIVKGETWMGFITEAKAVGILRGDNILYKIEDVNFICLTSNAYDSPSVSSTSTISSSYSGSSSSSFSSNYSTTSLTSRSYSQKQPPHPCLDLINLFDDGSFLFSYDWDCTRNTQKNTQKYSWFTTEKSFFWNRFMMKPIMKWCSSLSSLYEDGQESPLLDELMKSGLFVISFEGFFEVKKCSIYQLNSNTLTSISITSRVNCGRVGTRFRSRGIDDDGNVSNSVETEIILSHPTISFSYLIIRGTVPVFWDQQGIQLPFPKIQLTRSFAATQPSFDRHMRMLINSYGLVHLIDLLSQKPGTPEQMLSQALDNHCHRFSSSHCTKTSFDIYSVCKNQNWAKLENLFHLIGAEIMTFGYGIISSGGGADDDDDPCNTGVLKDDGSDDCNTKNNPKGNKFNLTKEQRGVFRINCLDSLDRTNMIQSYITKRTIDLFIRTHLLGHKTVASKDGSGNILLVDNVTPPMQSSTGDLDSVLDRMFRDHGDQLSRIYTGSDAIKSSYGRLGKFSLLSFVEDVKNNAKRFYNNNFTEKARQSAIDCILGRRANQSLPDIMMVDSDGISLSELSICGGGSGGYLDDNDGVDGAGGVSCIAGVDEDDLVIQVITWNNGSSPPVANGEYERLVKMELGDLCGDGDGLPHIVVIGFQEIVHLNATQIISSDPERRIVWERIILAHLNTLHDGVFSLLVSHQLVGVTMSIFCRRDHMDYIRKIEIASKKTGLGGMSGNKGSVGIRLDVHGSSICFVNSHFTAGQVYSNERDKDFQFTLNDLQTSGGRNLLDHDYIFWFGDMNYRIDLDRDIVLELIQEDRLDELILFDQLRIRMNEGLVFKNFKEGKLDFPPTYKYDTNTDNYDTSEKLRTPSWTDRILCYGENVDILSYGTCDIKLSDHKPVKGIFRVPIKSKVYGELDSDYLVARSKSPLTLNNFSSSSDGGNSSDLIDL